MLPKAGQHLLGTTQRQAWPGGVDRGEQELCVVLCESRIRFLGITVSLLKLVRLIDSKISLTHSSAKSKLETARIFQLETRLTVYSLCVTNYRPHQLEK